MFLGGTESRTAIWPVAAVGGTEIELRRKVRTKPGLKPGREECCLDSEGRDVVRPIEAGKTAKNKSYLAVFSENT